MTTTQFFRLSCAMLTLAISFSALQAHPIPGRDLTKFSQQPMIATTISNTAGTVLGTFQGHDEWSTAYGIGTAAQPPQDYQGRFMADDFADNFNTPVVHVKWWGSYRRDVINPNMPVDKFMISFESDLPVGPGQPFSRPDQPLLNQVVTRGPISPGSGTFTETLVRGPDPLLSESLYEYNAELHLGQEFFEKADTIYWLKIVAMVDIPQAFPAPFNTANPPPNATQWGWHNRDYTIQNPLASPNVVPGETQVGTVAGLAPIWHFQDDAVEGDIRILPGPVPGGFQSPIIFQQNYQPTNYLNGIDGPGPIPGTTFPGIGQFSKDLAFEIYTVVPEPATCALAVFGLAAVLVRRRMS